MEKFVAVAVPYFGAVLFGLLVLFLALRVKYGMRVDAKSKSGQEMIERAKHAGCKFRLHEVAGVLAVCSEQDFQKAWEEYQEEVREKKRKASDKVVLWVEYTFTFWMKPEAQTLMHTGNELDAKRLGQDIIEKITGIKKEDVFESDFHTALGIIIPVDGRLFVPFAGGMPEVEKQEKLYEHWPLSASRSYLLSCASSY